MRRGLFLTFEGLDGSGKTTQIRHLAAWLAADGSAAGASEPAIAPLLTRQPGGTATGDRIRALLLDSQSAAIAPMAELAMMFADRAQSIAEVIAPALGSGRMVICDRFTDSTEAYQGGGRELGSDVVLAMDRLVCGGLKPDLTILLLPPLETCLARARRRNARAHSGPDEGRFESERDAFFGRVWHKYREIAVREPERVIVIAGDLEVEATHQKVRMAVNPRLRRRDAAR